MTREEMIKRLLKGEDPLDLSIEKWADLVEHLNKITNLKEYNERLERGEYNCALCELYLDNTCAKCPVKIATGFAECRKTPYRHFWCAWISEDLEEMREAAIAELEFLKSLKKKFPKIMYILVKRYMKYEGLHEFDYDEACQITIRFKTNFCDCNAEGNTVNEILSELKKKLNKDISSLPVYIAHFLNGHYVSTLPFKMGLTNPK